MLDGYCERIENGSDVTYSYYEDWEEQMEDARYEIAQKVEALKSS